MGPDSCKSADKRQHSFFALISKIQHFGKTTLSRKYERKLNPSCEVSINKGFISKELYVGKKVMNPH
jgi:hypothetical protein